MISISIQIPEESKDSIKSDYELIKSMYEDEDEKQLIYFQK